MLLRYMLHEEIIISLYSNNEGISTYLNETEKNLEYSIIWQYNERTQSLTL